MDLPICDERYDRYHRRQKLALRLMLHGARAQTVIDMTGFTTHQLDTLRQRWLPGVEEGKRGPDPSSFTPFLRSSAKGSHAALFAGIFHVVGLVFAIPSLEAGERFCEAYEIYREWEPSAGLNVNQALLIATGTSKGDEIALKRCTDCGRAHLIDKRILHRRNCGRCRGLE